MAGDSAGPAVVAVTACEEVDISYGAGILSRQQNNEFCDIDLYGSCSDGQGSSLLPIKAHRVTLASASPHLHTAFTAQGFIDSIAKEYTIEEINHATLQIIINFVYTSKLSIADEINMEWRIESVLKGADYLLMPELTRVCGQALDKPTFLTVSNCVTKWLFARKFHSKNLEAAAVRITAANLIEITKQKAFLNLSKADIAAMLHDLSSNSPAEPDALCDVVVAWIEFDIVGRKIASNDVMRDIPLHEVSHSKLIYLLKEKRAIFVEESIRKLYHVGKLRERVEKLEQSLSSMVRHCETLEPLSKRARRAQEVFSIEFIADGFVVPPANSVAEKRRKADVKHARKLLAKVRTIPSGPPP